MFRRSASGRGRVLVFCSCRFFHGKTTDQIFHDENGKNNKHFYTRTIVLSNALVVGTRVAHNKNCNNNVDDVRSVDRSSGSSSRGRTWSADCRPSDAKPSVVPGGAVPCWSWTSRPPQSQRTECRGRRRACLSLSLSVCVQRCVCVVVARRRICTKRAAVYCTPTMARDGPIFIFPRRAQQSAWPCAVRLRYDRGRLFSAAAAAAAVSHRRRTAAAADDFSRAPPVNHYTHTQALYFKHTLVYDKLSRTRVSYTTPTCRALSFVVVSTPRRVPARPAHPSAWLYYIFISRRRVYFSAKYVYMKLVCEHYRVKRVYI